VLNPGFTSRVSDRDLKLDAGATIRCPECKKILMNADVVSLYMRCKHCGKWVYLEKIDSDGKIV